MQVLPTSMFLALKYCVQLCQLLCMNQHPVYSILLQCLIARVFHHRKNCTYLAHHELESVLIPIIDNILTERVAQPSHGCQVLCMNQHPGSSILLQCLIAQVVSLLNEWRT